MNREDMKLFLDFYNGRKETIFRHFLARRVADEVPKNERITMRDFYFQNDIRVIEDTRISFMPTTCEVVVRKRGEEEIHGGIAEKARRWLASPNFGGGKTFWEALGGYYLTQENYGSLFLKLFVKNGEVCVQKMHPSDVEIVVDEKNYLEVKKYVFSWDEDCSYDDGSGKTLRMREMIDRDSFTLFRDGELLKQDRHAFGFIPVITVLREEVEGSPYGRSGIEDLIEAQQNVNMALTKRAWATKYNSFRVWAPKETGFVEPGTTIKISPGALSPIPLEAVGGDVDLGAIERELEDALDHLYRLGSVPRKLKEEVATSTTSAKALNTLLDGLKHYTRRKLVYLKRGFEELIMKYLTIIYGMNVFEVTVNFPSLDREDPEHVLNRARFFAEHGFLDEAFRELGFDEVVISRMKETKKREEIPNGS